MFTNSGFILEHRHTTNIHAGRSSCFGCKLSNTEREIWHELSNQTRLAGLEQFWYHSSHSGGARVYDIDLWSHWLSCTCVRDGLNHHAPPFFLNSTLGAAQESAHLALDGVLCSRFRHHRMASLKAASQTEKLPGAERSLSRTTTLESVMLLHAYTPFEHPSTTTDLYIQKQLHSRHIAYMHILQYVYCVYTNVCVQTIYSCI